MFTSNSGLARPVPRLRPSGSESPSGRATLVPVMQHEGAIGGSMDDKPTFEEVADALWLQVRKAGRLRGEHTASITRCQHRALPVNLPS